jgi:hypothetical protein
VESLAKVAALSESVTVAPQHGWAEAMLRPEALASATTSFETSEFRQAIDEIGEFVLPVMFAHTRRAKSRKSSETTDLAVTFTSSGGVRSVAFTIGFDPGLLAVKGVTLGSHLPEAAGVTLKVVETDDGADAVITIASDECLPSGMIDLVNLSVQYLGDERDDLLDIRLVEVNSDQSGGRDAIRISIAGLSADTGDVAGANTTGLPHISADADVLARTEFEDGLKQKIRLKIPVEDTTPVAPSPEAVKAEDAWHGRIRIPHAETLSDGVQTLPGAMSNQNSRWKLNWSDSDNRATAEQKLRVPTSAQNAEAELRGPGVTVR